MENHDLRPLRDFEPKGIMMGVNEQVIDVVVLQILPRYLGPYVRRRLSEERPDAVWESPFRRHQRDAHFLDDLSEQIFVLTGKDRQNNPILSTDIEFRSKLHSIRKARNGYAHQRRFEFHEVLTCLGHVIDVLRAIDAPEGVAEVKRVLDHFIATRVSVSKDDDGILRHSEERSASHAEGQSPALTSGGPTPRSEQGNRAIDGGEWPAADRSCEDDESALPPALSVESSQEAPIEASGEEDTTLVSDRTEEEGASEALAVEVRFPEVLSYAHAVAGIKPRIDIELRSLGAGDDSDDEEELIGDYGDTSGLEIAQRSKPSSAPVIRGVRVSIAIESEGEPLITPFDFGADAVDGMGVTRSFDVDLNGGVLLQTLSETDSTVVVRCEYAGRVESTTQLGPKVLPPSHWMCTTHVTFSASALATFVQPQHPEIERLSKEASRILHEGTGAAALQGYQGGPARVDEIVEALCKAFFDRNIAYAVPPNNWAEIAQRVRNAELVLDGGLSTCLDSTLVLASALEHLEIEPLVIVLDGHSILGYWKTEQHASEEIAMPGWSVINPIARGEIGLIETTLLTSDSFPLLRGLHTSARSRLGEDGSNARFVLSIREARERGIGPQKTRIRTPDGVIVETAVTLSARPNTLDLGTLEKPAGCSRIRKERAPKRVEQWKADLLDLSVRNRLINCSESARSSHKIIEIAVPETILGGFEDLINSGRTITLVAAGDRAAAVRRQGGAFHQELEPPRLAPRLADHREVEVDLSEDVYDTTMRRLRSSARTLIDETGANSLYLALGTLVWQTKGKELRTPLVFIPVELEHVSKNAPYRLRIDPTGGTTPNYSLIERLRIDLGFELPSLKNPVEDDSGIDLPKLFDSVRKSLSDNRLPFRVEPTTYLGIFQFGAFRLWKDLDESWELLARNPLVKHLIEEPGKIFEDPALSNQVPSLEVVLPTLPIPADASQTDVVAHTVANRTLVVEGPPGTGKSQTITNVIIRALADGKKVMFVAEKRAALDVVARRLKAAGVGDLVLNLHDRKQKPDDVRLALLKAADLVVHANLTGLDVHRRLAASNLRLLGRYREALHAPSASGLSVYSARSTLLAYGDESQTLPISGAELARVDEDTIRYLKNEAIPALHSFLCEYREEPGDSYSFIRRPVAASNADELFALIEKVQSLPRLGFDQQTIEAISKAERADLERIASVLDSHRFDPTNLTFVRTPEWETAVSRFENEMNECGTMPADALSYFYTSVFIADLGVIRDRLIESKNAWFGKVKKVEKALSPLAIHRTSVPLPSNPNVLLGLVDNLIQLQHAHIVVNEQMNAVLPMYAKVRAGKWSPFDPGGRHEAHTFIAWLRDVADLVPQPGRQPNSTQALAATMFSSPDRSAVANRIRECLAVLSSVESHPALTGVGLLEIMNAPRASASERERHDVFRVWLASLDAVEPFRRFGFETAAETLLRRTVAPEQLETAFEKGLALATLEDGLSRPPLSAFSGDDHEKVSAGYGEELKTIRRMLPDAVLKSALDERSHNGNQLHQDRFAMLKSDLERRRKKKPIRDLVSEYGDLITELTPCVLVSPDSVARFFPPERQDFDLVVFDEASQITVASAIGAMGRGRAIVVCGDSKQMPPTSFAQITRDDEDDEVVDEESILSECIAAHVPRKWLTWHYRSQDESLIAFSNSRYYRGQLLSFPSPISGTAERLPEGLGVSLRIVDGEFLRSIPRGKSRKFYRTNPVEANAIVEEIRRRFDLGATPSIGVVTFNIQQRDLIEQRLRELDDSRITESLESDDGVFVKNLENVQGDERDTILFSVAFSAGANGEIPLTFGPLNRNGGERRLNVAITRARREVILFASFAPSALRAERSQSVGLKDLKAYLQLAEQGAVVRNKSRRVRSLPDHHREDVAKALRHAGLVVSTDVGLSEFRLDLVLAAPDTPDRPVVAVLLDGAGWNLRKTAYDRDLLPCEVLSSTMRWPHVERVWLPEWLEDRDSVVRRLVDLTVNIEAETNESLPDQPGDSTKHVGEGLQNAEVAGLVVLSQQTEEASVEVSPPAAASDEPLSPEARTVPPEEVTTTVSSRASALIDESRGIRTDIGSPFPSRRSLHCHDSGDETPSPWDLRTPVQFTPAQVENRGPREYLDLAGSSPSVREHIRETARMICGQEFPIDGRRFRYLVARAYGFERMHSSREEQISRIVGTADFIVDEFGFYWPNEVDPADLVSYRRNAFDVLDLDQIHPKELDNLVREVLATLRNFATRKEKVRAVFNRLGKSKHRLTPRFHATLEDAIDRVQSQQANSHEGQ